MWANLSYDDKVDLLYRRYVYDEPIESLAQEVGMTVITLNRQLQRLRSVMDDDQPDWQDNIPDGVKKPEKEKERLEATHMELYQLLRKNGSGGSVSLDFICTQLDRSPSTVFRLIDEMREKGYTIDVEKQRLRLNPVPPKVVFNPPSTLADLAGQEIVFAVGSDLHAGSTHSQPTAFNKFVKIAYEEYGVRHFFVPGDITSGVGGYRGQEWDTIKPIRWSNSRGYHDATLDEIWLANAYIPAYPGLKYYILGGNHDYWHIVNSGMDAVRNLVNQREDMFYMGYDNAEIPLTDRAMIRLWHPTGGVPYALSYRLQKSVEQVAFDELSRAVETSDNPKLRVLLAGHLHVELKFRRGPIIAAQVGCFEGQTNYLVRKGLVPSIGGAIFKIKVTDTGIIQRDEYTFIPFTEVKDDWENWPVPPSRDVDFESEKVETLFKLR